MPSERILRQIKARLSLRKPQADSLDILADIVEHSPLNDLVPFQKTVDPGAMLDALRARYPGVTDFERDFASLCFALATGVGKTRLMGAFISYLYLSGRSKHFFVLAPNTTIYDKLPVLFIRLGRGGASWFVAWTRAAPLFLRRLICFSLRGWGLGAGLPCRPPRRHDKQPLLVGWWRAAADTLSRARSLYGRRFLCAGAELEEAHADVGAPRARPRPHGPAR